MVMVNIKVIMMLIGNGDDEEDGEDVGDCDDNDVDDDVADGVDKDC